MKRLFRFCSAGGLMLAAIIASAANERFDIKPGLWEMSVESETSGTLPMSDEQLRTLTPRQRDVIEQATGINRGPHTRILKSCITQEKLNRDDNVFDSATQGMTCSTNRIVQTRSDASGTLVCSQGNKNLSEEFSYHAHDREHVDGSFHVVNNEGTHTLTIKGKQTAHWVSAQCGSVR